MTPEDFAGDWHVDRTITDRYADQTGWFAGTAQLTPAGADALTYEERGQVQFGQGPKMFAERRYHWQFEQARVLVRFADGRDFHSFVPTGAGAGTDHLCGADLYRVTYDFTQWQQWTATWDVSGPRKGYTMHSRYAR